MAQPLDQLASRNIIFTSLQIGDPAKGKIEGRVVTFPFNDLPAELKAMIGNVSDLATRMCLYLTSTELYDMSSRPRLTWSMFAKEAMLHDHLDLFQYGLGLGISKHRFLKWLPEAAKGQNQKVVLALAPEANSETLDAIAKVFEQAVEFGREEEFKWLSAHIPDDRKVTARTLGHLRASRLDELKKVKSFDFTTHWKFIFTHANADVVRWLLNQEDVMQSALRQLFSRIDAIKGSAANHGDLEVFLVVDHQFPHPANFAIAIKEAVATDNLPFLQLHVGTDPEKRQTLLDVKEGKTYPRNLVLALANHAFKVFDWLMEISPANWSPEAVNDLSRVNQSLSSWLPTIVSELERRNLPFQLNDLTHLSRFADFKLFKRFIEAGLGAEMNFRYLFLDGTSPERFLMIKYLLDQAPDLINSSVAKDIFRCQERSETQRLRLLNLTHLDIQEFLTRENMKNFNLPTLAAIIRRSLASSRRDLTFCDFLVHLFLTHQLKKREKEKLEGKLYTSTLSKAEEKAIFDLVIESERGFSIYRWEPLLQASDYLDHCIALLRVTGIIFKTFEVLEEMPLEKCIALFSYISLDTCRKMQLYCLEKELTRCAKILGARQKSQEDRKLLFTTDSDLSSSLTADSLSMLRALYYLDFTLFDQQRKLSPFVPRTLRELPPNEQEENWFFTLMTELKKREIEIEVKDVAHLSHLADFETFKF